MLVEDETLLRVTLVLGGVRSGKSRYAEQCVEDMAQQKVYIATAQRNDSEMIERINKHRARRGSSWQTVEEPIDLTGVLKTHRNSVILVDCLTLWLTNLMLAGHDIDKEISDLVLELREAKGNVFLVSNEVGLGIMPDNALARRFCDTAGQMNQEIASEAASVVLVTAGIPQIKKSS